MDGLHKKKQALRAIEMVATSGFLRDKRGLKQSCLGVCNLCREGLTLRCLKLPSKAPRTLLAVVWPDPLGTKGEGASRVLLPKKVLKVKWHFDDPATMKGEEEEEEKEKEQEGGEEEEAPKYHHTS